MTHDPDHVVNMMHHHVGNLEWSLKADRQYFDKLTAAILEGERVHPESLPAIYLKNDAASLRRIADDFDRLLMAISDDRMPVSLIAAE